MVAIAAISAGAGVLSAGASIIGSSNAADAQTEAAQMASDTQMSMFNKEQANLQPYMDLGQTGINNLTAQLGGLTGQPALPGGAKFGIPTGIPKMPSMMTQDQLEATPGYKFNLSQGLKSTQNSAAARGLGVSGAAEKGASTFATGLADSTYQNQFTNLEELFGNAQTRYGDTQAEFANKETLFGNQQQKYTDTVTNQTNSYNRLMALIGQGQSSAAGVGAAGIQTGANIGANTIGAGNASAAADMSMANGVTSSANSVLSAYTTNNLLKQLTGGGGGTVN